MRARSTEALARGAVFANLNVSREGAPPIVRVNEPVLAAVLKELKKLSGEVAAKPPTLDGILALKGVIEVIDEDEKEEDRRAAEAAVVAGFQETVAELAAMRRHEGAALSEILMQRLNEIAALAARADAAPGRRAEAIPKLTPRDV